MGIYCQSCNILGLFLGILRMYLAVCVFFVHAPTGFSAVLPNGVFAVRAFYSISGFYIALVWAKKYGNAKRGVLFFWFNRWLRLAPAYILVSLIIVLTQIKQMGTFRGFEAMPIPILLFAITSNIILIGQDLFSFVV